MIGRIQGKLLEISDNLLLIDVGGLAYEVEATSSALAGASGTGAAGLATGSEVALFTHFIVREDAQLLYGFGSRTERDVFRDLIRISGVGPKMALAIVSSLTLEVLAAAVRDGDVSQLTRVQGVGKKTAERLLVELKDRLGNLHVVVKPVSVGADKAATREAEDALVSLGYRPAEASRAVAAVADEVLEDTGEALLRAALKQIARQAEVG
ncbi:MAG: Holliday junction branch migration protein RuvA [Pseudomonadota bacterium]